MPQAQSTGMTPLQELAAYAAADRITRPEEFLRLAKLAIAEVVHFVDTHPDLEMGAKWRLLETHPIEGSAGLKPLSKLIACAEEALLVELDEVALPYVCAPDLAGFPDDADLHSEPPLSADAALHGLVRAEVR